jgi:hypothetical protein
MINIAFSLGKIISLNWLAGIIFFLYLKYFWLAQNITSFLIKENFNRREERNDRLSVTLIGSNIYLAEHGTLIYYFLFSVS